MNKHNYYYTPYLRDQADIKQKKVERQAEREGHPIFSAIRAVFLLVFLGSMLLAALIVSPWMLLGMLITLFVGTMAHLTNKS